MASRSRGGAVRAQTKRRPWAGAKKQLQKVGVVGRGRANSQHTHEQQPKPRSHNEVGVVCAVRRGGANHRTNQQGRQVTGIGYLIDLAVPPAAQRTGRGFREKPYFGRRFYIKRFFLNCRFRILNPVFWPNSLTLEGRFRR